MPQTETTQQLRQWYIFHDGTLLLERHHEADGDTYHIPCSPVSQPPLATDGKAHTVLMDDGRTVMALEAGQAVDEHDEQWLPVGLRNSYSYLTLADYQAAGKAYQILFWDKHSRYCPACGTPTEQHTPIMKRCPTCGYELYPPIATAIIVLVRRGDEILLVHARNFRGTFYGLVAGFLEAGETLEQCVEREVKEETGLNIKNITYFASQPWPYPSGLMVGFFADYDSGEIKLQDDELSAGAFYSRDNLPELPQKLSIARRLIDYWLEHDEGEERHF